jgi:hypothetical protein
MPTGAIAHFQLAIGRWEDIHDSTAADLIALWQPREVKG